ncbi:MAG: 2-oxo acid dehydrogenase subunit E2 [Actinobacteria bacterium]|nr:2-oxo acid dehydrogenase subunit E2 [Actinomycetota bacterium]
MAKGNTLRRKLAIASWSAPREGNIYGKVTVDAGAALAYLAHVQETTGEKVTITHLVGKAVGQALAAEPSLNGYLRLGRYVPHDEVAVAFLVSMPDGSDLAKAKVRRIDGKSVAEIARDLRERADRLRAGEDDDWERSKGVIRLLPTQLLRPVLWLVGLLSSSFGLEARSIGVEPFPFGSAIVTSVGMFGLDEAWVPPTPFARVPLYVLIGAVTDRAVVVDGAVQVRPQVTLTATVDHRFIDGFQGGVLAREFRRVFEDPWSLDGLDGPPVRKGSA